MSPYLFGLIIFHFFLTIKKSLSIIIPIKTYIQQYNNSEMVSYWISRKLYSNIEIGSEKQNVLLYLSLQENSFYLDKLEEKNKIEDISSQYNYNKSTTCELLTPFDKYYGNSKKKGAFISDDFYFLDNINEPKKQYKNISFFLSSKDDIDLYFTIGLGLQKKLNDKGFIEILKDKNYIKNYYWFLNYRNNGEIILIIGQKQHEYYPQNFSENQIKVMNSYCSSSFLKWGILFNKIFINNQSFNDLLDSEIDFNYGAIIIPSDYWDYISKIYFNDYIKLNSCSMDMNSDKMRYFYCNQNNFDRKDIIKAPIIKFYSVQFNYTFEIKGEDLFELKNDKYFFLLFSQTFTFSWILGKPFLKKYSFLYNTEARTISFYNPKIPYQSPDIDNNLKNKINQNYIYLIVLLGLIFIFIVILIVFLFNKSHKQRKKRLNEREDEFIYKPHDNNESNNIIN